MAENMDSFEKNMGYPRATQTVVLTLGTPNTADFLSREYQLPEPYTVEEYRAVIANIQARWEAGERTPQEGGGVNG